jgi:hypothetical protein
MPYHRQSGGPVVNIQQANLVKALKLGLIDWFEYFRLWRALKD